MTAIEDLVRQAALLGWSVEFKPYCEDAETPGFLGQIAGVCVHSRRALKIATEGRTPEQIEAALRHELAHALGEEHAESGPGVVCGGRRNAFGEKI